MKASNRKYESDKPRLLAKLAAMLTVWAIAWYFLHGEVYTPLLNNLFPASTAFILLIVISFVSSAAFMIGMIIFFIIRRENVTDPRSFFKIEHLDVRGIWLAFGLGIAFQIINIAFLYKLLLEPARNFLTQIGIAGAKIGLGSGETVPLLSPLQATLLTVFLLVFWWLEVPEEIFFRGYIQNKLQNAAGKNTAMFLSALIWDLAHIFDLVNIVERFFHGLIYAFVFRMRQNTTPTMIVHPISNRSLLLAVVIPQIWGLTLQGAQTWLFLLALYIILLLAVMAGWKILKLDRK